MKIQENSLVSIDYHLTNEKGETIDQSTKDQPLEYLHGRGMLIPGLEAELEGKKRGDKFSVEVDPENAYGIPKPDLIKELHRSLFSADQEISVGMHFNAQGSGGETHLIKVVAVEEDMITVDGNHPLAGQTLFFKVAVQEVKEATEKQIQDGHP